MNAFRVALLALVCVPLLLTAKGPTLKITIKGVDLASPVEITDEGVLGQFRVWAGAGVAVNGIPQTEGFIVDWEKGPVSAPALPRYEVSFHVTYLQQPSSYVVLYSFDPATGKGYAYLPGEGERHYDTNTNLITRKVEGSRRLEGNWFAATGAWTDTATSAIERAKKGIRNSR